MHLASEMNTLGYTVVPMHTALPMGTPPIQLKSSLKWYFVLKESVMFI